MGAEVQILDVGYDETVIHARSEAVRLADLSHEQKVLFIQDTTLENYWTIPKHIMQGYMTIFAEAWATGNLDAPDQTPTHVLLQVGVGTFSGGMSGFLVNKMKELKKEIKIITVEPRGAHCVFRSHQMGDGELHGNENKQIF